MIVGRYLYLTWAQIRASAAFAMQYRIDFVLEGLMSIYWLAWNLIPLAILYNQRASVAGWSFAEALVVIGYFTALRGLLEGAINPSLEEVVDRVRIGTFDYVLLKPADAQFLVSTARILPWKLLDVLGGIGLVVFAFARLGRVPDAADVAVAAVMLACAAVVLYSLWILVVAASFWVIRLDNLTYLFTAIFDAARWPVQVFRGAWRFVFTFVIPLAIMTTYPAMAILGTLSWKTAVLAIAGAAITCAIARALWNIAIGHYTSASS